MASSTLAPAGRRINLTPVKQTSITAAPVKESPGNWRHPRLAEITRRQSRTIFSEKNVKQVVYNIAALTLVISLRTLVQPYWPTLLFGAELREYGGWLYLTLILIPLFNIVRALLPLIRPADDLADIPLTAAQRQLLGLPPSSAPPTPNSVYSTPPRYTRTPSLAGSPASMKSYSSSPNAGFGSPASVSNSPYSPSPASPLLQKAVGGALNGTRRSSFGSPSPLGVSTATSLFGDGPATPTPAAGKRSSVSLNNKWLYEKGRRSSSNNTWLYQGL
ncbi:nuclear pore complex component-domain-containing protein [Lasiosphaeris hirsuta]|uniref:Nuclear pore complex component-domain-containing protein n=1 Tax=Lasiosphaeris hirsuta TaxID=260670 RepID=A0AA40DX44_9PEZI|nr:nuclear pore complex component-domain-containing protein [Lasiosphaeris hirsuta]